MKTVVIKIGTKLLTTEDGKLDLNNLRSLVDQISIIKHTYHIDCVVVSSGAITCGSETLLMSPSTISEKQASASVGQLVLLREYQQFFGFNHINIGQILLTKDIMSSSEQKHNAQQAISTLLSFNIIPIINENDSVITDEIQFGDNDILSSFVATIISADALIMLTDQDGVYDKNPHDFDDATLYQCLSEVPDSMIDSASDALDSTTKGGIKSKLLAAKYCLDHDILTIVANGRSLSILEDIINKKPVGTWFQKKQEGVL